MKVDFLDPERAADLEKFVAAHPHGSIEQTWVWGELQTTIPGRNAMFVLAVLDDDERIIASMHLIRQHMGRGKYWLWCPGGPLLPEDEAEREAAWILFRDYCKQLAKREGDVFLRVESNYEPGALKLGGRMSKECYLPRNTLMINLESKTESILAQMKQKGRYNIRQAEKAGVYVRQANDSELDSFYAALVETAERDGFHLHAKKFYASFLELLEDKARFYVAHKENEFLGGMLVTHFGDTATYYFGASGGAHRRSMAPYALQWFAMQEAKAAGMKRYDFLGIAPAGRAGKKHVLAGVTQFKTRFGGKRIEYAPARIFVYRRGWWLARRIIKMLSWWR